MDSEQQENLVRVSARIKPSILRFCEAHMTPKTFHAEELRCAVIRDTGITAPGSADRVFRDMRQKKEIGYRVLSRRESLYEVQWIKNRPSSGNGNGNIDVRGIEVRKAIAECEGN